MLILRHLYKSEIRWETHSLCFLQADISRKNQGHLTIDYTKVAYLDNVPSTNPESNPLFVHDISYLLSKHRPAEPAPFCNVGVEPPSVHCIVFECINAVLLCVWKGQQGHSWISFYSVIWFTEHAQFCLRIDSTAWKWWPSPWDWYKKGRFWDGCIAVLMMWQLWPFSMSRRA